MSSPCQFNVRPFLRFGPFSSPCMRALCIAGSAADSPSSDAARYSVKK